jgi:hypothetical protein
VRRSDPFQISGDHPHCRQSNGQLGERQRLEGAALDRQQFERTRDVGNRLGADRFVRDQQCRQLGDLSKRIADGGGISCRATGGDTGGTKRPCGVCSDARQCLREFQRF